ncbi:MAG: GNAT family N-acetyltransferase [Planctomycetota bacterium]|jgi:predicted N-acetyltransferase YhbS
MNEITGEDMIRTYDRIVVRTLEKEDLDAIVRVDERIVGRSRHEYLDLKLREALRDTRVVVSLGAEVEGIVAGFLMGRLYFGEFGVPEPVAVLDTIGVDPDYRGQGVGSALLDQFLTNVRALGIETVRTEAEWKQWDLFKFLVSRGFAPAQRVCLEASI